MENASFTGDGRLYNTMQRAYRMRVYRPARYYLTWYFLMSLGVSFLPIWNEYLIWRAGGLPEAAAALWYNIPGFLAGLFLVLLSTYYAMISSSLHLALGDKGIYSLGSVPATSPVITKSTFIITTPEQKALYESKFWGGRLTRYNVWRWGRKGGCQNWPGKAGGKSEGFFATIVYSWDEVDYIDEATNATKHEAIEWQPCTSCNGDRKGEKLGFVKVPPMSAAMIADMATDYPGTKRGGVIDIRRQITSDVYPENLPYQLADAITHDEEFRASSRVDVGMEPLPDGGGLGTMIPHNAEIRLYGQEYAMKLMQKKIVDLQQQLTVISQLEVGRLGGSGQPGQPGASQPRQQ